MRFWVGVLTALVMSAVAAGCTQQGRQDGYAVFFDGSIQLFDEGVYFNGTPVGTILSQETGNGNITRLTLSLSPEFVASIGNNLAFYAHKGRIEAVRLQRIGQVMGPKMPLCGFTSRTELAWFKFKTLIDDRISVANQRAASLQARFGA